ncbi:hypothetical protein PCANC_26811 [Puccinia coronata f. sp. avenae]|uniref:Uncharacterized protein n=1 Tax=Puccinia coronata f. sp. avenae TaxID=200324 RepID=A0A2N5U8P1_9BASI|nr:hypothetical protein PCANC_26811 [Puccinia coronata f. sp. avenae]
MTIWSPHIQLGGLAKLTAKGALSSQLVSPNASSLQAQSLLLVSGVHWALTTAV